ILAGAGGGPPGAPIAPEGGVFTSLVTGAAGAGPEGPAGAAGPPAGGGAVKVPPALGEAGGGGGGGGGGGCGASGAAFPSAPGAPGAGLFSVAAGVGAGFSAFLQAGVRPAQRAANKRVPQRLRFIKSAPLQVTSVPIRFAPADLTGYGWMHPENLTRQF